MRHIQNSHRKSLVVMALGTLVIVIVIAFSTLGGSTTQFTAQAFQSLIETPTPISSPMPTPLSPTPPSGHSLEKDGEALLDHFENTRTSSGIPNLLGVTLTIAVLAGARHPPIIFIHILTRAFSKRQRPMSRCFWLLARRSVWQKSVKPGKMVMPSV